MGQEKILKLNLRGREGRERGRGRKEGRKGKKERKKERKKGGMVNSEQSSEH
jgi:hypothetical protein